jgi:hypothetical protein
MLATHVLLLFFVACEFAAAEEIYSRCTPHGLLALIARKRPIYRHIGIDINVNEIQGLRSAAGTPHIAAPYRAVISRTPEGIPAVNACRMPVLEALG